MIPDVIRYGAGYGNGSGGNKAYIGPDNVTPYYGPDGVTPYFGP